MSLRGIVVLAGIGAAVGCSGGGSPAHIEISGMTPDAGAAVAAQAVCTHETKCGDYAIVCIGGGAAGGSGSDAQVQSTTCTASFEPGNYDQCFKDASATIAQLLACPAITATDVDTLDTCFDALVAQKCETQAEANARALAAEAGTSASEPQTPAACALLMAPPASCGFPPKR